MCLLNGDISGNRAACAARGTAIGRGSVLVRREARLVPGSRPFGTEGHTGETLAMTTATETTMATMQWQAQQQRQLQQRQQQRATNDNDDSNNNNNNNDDSNDDNSNNNNNNNNSSSSSSDNNSNNNKTNTI